MPSFTKPWLRRGRGWYLTLDGKQIPLGADRVRAFEEYHRLMQLKEAEKQPRVRPSSMAALIDCFLEWVQKSRRADTYIWYQSRLQTFLNRYPDLTVGRLKPFHVQQWIDALEVASGTKRNYARSIMRCMKWAEEQGYIDKSPIAHFRKPRGGVRQTVILPDEYQRILGVIQQPSFRDLVTFAWETGARAAECLAIEARHVESARIVFPVEEEKMERAARVIYLSPLAQEIVDRLVKKWPDGKLFRNADGVAWKTEAVNCAFIRVQQKLGKKYCLTAFRHSFCHRLLKAGVDALTVSNLMGHAGVSMVVEFYSHMNHAPDYLRESLKKASP